MNSEPGELDKKEILRAFFEPSFASMRLERVHQLVTEIGGCSVAFACLVDDDPESPCQLIVRSQSEYTEEKPFQGPQNR